MIDMTHAGHQQSAFIDTANLDTAKKIGIFRSIQWGSERAYEAAQEFFARITAQGRLDDDAWRTYYSYADAVHEAPNLGIQAGLRQLLNAAADLSPTIKFGGPTSATNKGFLGVSNGLVAVTNADTDMSGTSRFYKGIDPLFPALDATLAKMTWQATYGTGEAQFQWNEGMVGATLGTVPNAGAGGAGVSALPATGGAATALAIALWGASPGLKGNAVWSQQYSLSVS